MATRFGSVAMDSARPSVVIFCGNPIGSQDFAAGSFVAPGPNLPIGFLSAMIVWANGVNTGFSAPPPRGTAGLEPGPFQVPDKSRFGAGPPLSLATSVG